MKTTISKSKILVLTLLLTISWPEMVLSQSESFGQTGRAGQNGNNGSPGRNGQDVTVVVEGKSLSYDLTGKNGEDGTDGQPGEDARGCSQPTRTEYSLTGASGGKGGNGGKGGDGGDGGDILLYYTNDADLKQITINNGGGKGGQAGQGTMGGQGCGCRETRWSINYCRWQLWRRLLHPKQSQSNPWRFDSNCTVKCTGVRRIDERENYPSLPSHYRYNTYWFFQWFYKGIYNTRDFTCQSGADGAKGQKGANGQNGSYGKVTLVPRKDIPREKTSYTSPLSSLLGNTIELAQNIWVQKRGLVALLASGSDVPDVYTYLDRTVRLRYRVNWESQATPKDLGVEDTEIGAWIDLNGNTPTVDFNVPGTLEYRITQDPSNVKILTITGGFSPDRVEAFQLGGVSGSEENNQLVLTDLGQVRSLLKSMTIEVIASSKESASGLTVTKDYQERHRYKYDIPPQGSLRTGLTENNHVYTLDVGRHFNPWLKPGYHVRYEIIITQVTKMGAVYTQRQEISFVAQ